MKFSFLLLIKRKYLVIRKMGKKVHFLDLLKFLLQLHIPGKNKLKVPNLNKILVIFFYFHMHVTWYFSCNPNMLWGGAAMVGSLVVRGKHTLDSSLHLAPSYGPNRFSNRSDWLHLETLKSFPPKYVRSFGDIHVNM